MNLLPEDQRNDRRGAYTGTVIAAFVDESGNDGQSQVFAMATVLLSYGSSYYFGNDWKAMLKDFSVTEFHACDFHVRLEFPAFQHAAIKLFQRWQVKHSLAHLRKSSVSHGCI